MAENEQAAGGEKKNKKISRCTVAELDICLGQARKQMGSDQSRYIRHLLAKKKTLVKK